MVYMFENNKVLAALYFIACVACVIAFFGGGHKWGYLVAAVVWLMLGIYLLVRKDDDIG
jgi:Na+/melibiose symporter-like transporter